MKKRGLALNFFLLQRYTFDLPKAILDEVHDHFNCEDIFMSAMVSDLTSLPPFKALERKEVFCTSKECTGGRGISQGGDHYQRRDVCTNKVVGFFGYQSLIESTVSVDTFARTHPGVCEAFRLGNKYL